MSEFKSKDLFEQITNGLKEMDDKEKKDIQKKVSLPFTARRRCFAPSPVAFLASCARAIYSLCVFGF